MVPQSLLTEYQKSEKTWLYYTGRKFLCNLVNSGTYLVGGTPKTVIFPYYSRLCQSLPHTCRAWGVPGVSIGPLTSMIGKSKNVKNDAGGEKGGGSYRLSANTHFRVSSN